MIARSVTVVHSKVIPIADLPLPTANEVRPPFRSVFVSRRCFEDLRGVFWNPTEWGDDPDTFWMEPVREKDDVPAGPFVPGVGAIWLDLESTRFADTGTRSRLAALLADRRRYWDPAAGPEGLDPTQTLAPPEDWEAPSEWDPTRDPEERPSRAWSIFGFEPGLEDQRMNHLYFELRKPVKLTAMVKGDGKTKWRQIADSRCYVHFHPSGFVVLHVSTSFKQPVLRSRDALNHALDEARPWHRSGTWRWISDKLGEGSLNALISRLEDRLTRSISAAAPTVRIDRWYEITRYRPNDHEQWQSLNAHLEGSFPTRRNLGSRPALRDGQDLGDDEVLYLNRHTAALCLEPVDRSWSSSTRRLRSRGFRSFWKTVLILELVLLKQTVFRQYTEFLRHEVLELRRHRLGPSATPPVGSQPPPHPFRSTVPRHLLALDDHTRTAPAFWQFVYSELADAIRLDEQRAQTMRHLERWEDEVARWKPPPRPTGDYVFISYDRDDRDYVDRLVAHLDANGIRSWLDESGIKFGSEWPKAIAEALDSCAAVVVVMTPSAWDSEWVGNEVEIARSQGKPILPLLAEGEPFLTLATTQYEDVRGDNMPGSRWIERILETIA